jgi:hypothetical protein
MEELRHGNAIQIADYFWVLLHRFGFFVSVCFNSDEGGER